MTLESEQKHTLKHFEFKRRQRMLQITGKFILRENNEFKLNET